MPALNTDLFSEVGSPGSATTLAAPGFTTGGSTFNVVSTSNWPTNTAAIFAVDTFTIQTVNGVPTAVRNPNSYAEFEGVVTNSTTISNAVLRFGSPQNYPAGANTRVYIPVSSTRENRLVQGIQLFANQDGTLKTASVQNALGLTNLNGYTPLGQVPSSVTYNGNRSYDIVLPTDLTGVVSNGMRLRTTRTVAAPTQCTNLNGTTQYYNKTTPAGYTFTTAFTYSSQIKLASYPTGNAYIISRLNSANDSGSGIFVNNSGQLNIIGRNGTTNFRLANSYQSLPLNKWVHVTATLDMAAGTATIYFDGVLVPSTAVTTSGTASVITQAGDLAVGARTGGVEFFPGKISQSAVFSAVLAAATVRSYISQSLLGTETALVSAHSFNNSINDLNTTNANNLTANGGAVATNADSPFTQDDTGTPSGSNDFAIVTKKVFSTNTTLTVQVPEGCAIPTIGGVSSVVYSSNKAPFGFPNQITRWSIFIPYRVAPSVTGVASTWTNTNAGINVPIGSWKIGFSGPLSQNNTSSNIYAPYATLSTSPSTQTDLDLSVDAISRASGTGESIWPSSVSKSLPDITTSTQYYLLAAFQVGGGTVTFGFTNTSRQSLVIYVENAYL